MCSITAKCLKVDSIQLGKHGRYPRWVLLYSKTILCPKRVLMTLIWVYLQPVLQTGLSFQNPYTIIACPRSLSWLPLFQPVVLVQLRTGFSIEPRVQDLEPHQSSVSMCIFHFVSSPFSPTRMMAHSFSRHLASAYCFLGTKLELDMLPAPPSMEFWDGIYSLVREM